MNYNDTEGCTCDLCKGKTSDRYCIRVFFDEQIETEKSIEKFFQFYGAIKKVFFANNDGKSCGYAFVEFYTKLGMDNALNDKESFKHRFFI
jgi:hypothetical protein